MRKIQQKYIQILRLELEDLETDIKKLIAECEKSRESREWSTNVFMENLAIFNNELLGVNIFENFLTSLDIEKFTTLDEMVEFILKEFQKKVKELGLVPAINRLIERKLQKVADYVSRD